MIGGATLSPCAEFRYRLWRVWSSEPRLVFVMLNPSTADATVPDPTITKCIGFAKRLGYGSIEVVNLFAFRATYPRDLRIAGYPVGPDNDKHIRAACSTSGVVLCAWGGNAAAPVVRDRARAVFKMLEGYPVFPMPMALRINADGTPAHPLMLPYSCVPESWCPR